VLDAADPPEQAYRGRETTNFGGRSTSAGPRTTKNGGFERQETCLIRRVLPATSGQWVDSAHLLVLRSVRVVTRDRPTT